MIRFIDKHRDRFLSRVHPRDVEYSPWWRCHYHPRIPSIKPPWRGTHGHGRVRSSAERVMYTAFIVDVDSRRIRLGGHYRTRCARQAPATASPSSSNCQCAKETAGLGYHANHGSEYLRLVSNERLAEYGIAASTGSVGDWYDNALADNVNGSNNNELILTRTWKDVVDVGNTTIEWVPWWNESRFHQSLGYYTPVEVETKCWEQNPGHFTPGVRRRCRRKTREKLRSSLRSCLARALSGLFCALALQ